MCTFEERFFKDRNSQQLFVQVQWYKWYICYSNIVDYVHLCVFVSICIYKINCIVLWKFLQVMHQIQLISQNYFKKVF